MMRKVQSGYLILRVRSVTSFFEKECAVTSCERKVDVSGFDLRAWFSFIV